MRVDKSKSNGIGTSPKDSRQWRRNSIIIELLDITSVTALAKNLAHEFGHAEALATNMLGWYSFYNPLSKEAKAAYDGHGGKNDPSDENAKRRETEYVQQPNYKP